MTKQRWSALSSDEFYGASGKAGCSVTIPTISLEQLRHLNAEIWDYTALYASARLGCHLTNELKTNALEPMWEE